jgi:hypothetical protein
MDAINEDKKQEKYKPKRDPKGKLLPGECGNPHGRPRGSSYKTRFKHLVEKYSIYKAPQSIIDGLKSEFPGVPDNILIEEAEAFRVHLAALSGESWAFDRLFDKPAQGVDVTTDGEKITAEPDINGLSPEAIKKLSDAIIAIKTVTK